MGQQKNTMQGEWPQEDASNVRATSPLRAAPASTPVSLEFDLIPRRSSIPPVPSGTRPAGAHKTLTEQRALELLMQEDIHERDTEPRIVVEALDTPILPPALSPAERSQAALERARLWRVTRAGSLAIGAPYEPRYVLARLTVFGALRQWIAVRLARLAYAIAP